MHHVRAIPLGRKDKDTTMARKKLNLATAKQADGSLAAVRDVYSMVGISATPYKITDRNAYSKAIGGLSLPELHEEAYRVGVMTHPDRQTQITRLEQKFITESTKFGAGIPAVQSNGVQDPDLKAQAEQILSRGR